MQINIQALNIPLSDVIRAHVRRRLGFALSTHDDHILKVNVRLSDINGPHGGKDQCCQIQVILPNLADVLIEDTETDLTTAIDRAAGRAGRTAARQLARRRDKVRSPVVIKPLPLAE